MTDITFVLLKDENFDYAKILGEAAMKIFVNAVCWCDFYEQLLQLVVLMRLFKIKYCSVLFVSKALLV